MDHWLEIPEDPNTGLQLRGSGSFVEKVREVSWRDGDGVNVMAGVY